MKSTDWEKVKQEIQGIHDLPQHPSVEIGFHTVDANIPYSYTVTVQGIDASCYYGENRVRAEVSATGDDLPTMLKSVRERLSAALWPAPEKEARP